MAHGYVVNNTTHEHYGGEGVPCHYGNYGELALFTQTN